MKIAIPTEDGIHVAGHAGQARHWLIYDSDRLDAGPEPLALEPAQVLHHWRDEGPHPLDDVDMLVASSAGDAFVRRMTTRGVQVILTGERDAARAARAVIDGEDLPEPRFTPHLLFCKLRDLFSKH